MSGTDFLGLLDFAAQRLDSTSTVFINSAISSRNRAIPDKSYISNAQFEWKTILASNSNQMIEKLSFSYRAQQLEFVCVMQSKTYLTVLLRFRNKFVLAGGSDQETMANISVRLDMSSIPLKLIGKEYTAQQFEEIFRGFEEEGNVLGCVGCLPYEHKGFRSDLDLSPEKMNSYYGSKVSASVSSKYAPVNSIFYDRMKALTSNMLRSFYEIPYGADSVTAAINLGADRAVSVSITASLMFSISVTLVYQAISGSDINNFLSNLGVVAVGDGSYGAGRGSLRELSSRAFVLGTLSSTSITSEKRERLVWKLPYGNHFEGMRLWREQELEDEEMSCLDIITKKINAAKASGYPIKVFLVELVSSDTMQSLRGAFLSALGRVLKNNSIILAVDDIMAGLRCGWHLSIQLFGEVSGDWPIIPDLVCIGKAYGTAALLALNISNPPSGLQKEMMDTLSESKGIVTSHFDQLQLCRLQELLRITSQPRVLEHVRNMPSIIHEHFKQYLQKFKGSFIVGIGAMHFTNFQFGPRTEDLVKFHRLLPCLEASEQDFAQLKPIGVFPRLCEGVSPDHAQKKIQFSRLWPKEAPLEIVSDQDAAKKRKIPNNITLDLDSCSPPPPAEARNSRQRQHCPSPASWSARPPPPPRPASPPPQPSAQFTSFSSPLLLQSAPLPNEQRSGILPPPPRPVRMRPALSLPL
jgi:hypothetical protein